LKQGELVNLYVSEQQYVYARKSKAGAVVVAVNNASNPVNLEFDVLPAGLANDDRLVDRLNATKELHVENGNLRISQPARSVAVLVRR
jgi:PDZ domain-containing secreted protein